MKTIHVVNSFVLTKADGTKQEFGAGLHKVEDELAEHWYVKAHSEEIVQDAQEAAAPAARTGRKSNREAATEQKTEEQPKAE